MLNSHSRALAAAVTLTLTQTAGKQFSAVTINGSGFSTVTTEDTVKFNGVQAYVNSATATQIVATVPLAASSGKVTVTTKNGTQSSVSDFKVIRIVKKEVIPVGAPITAMTFDKAGNIYFTESRTIYKQSPDGKVTKLFYALIPPFINSGDIYTRISDMVYADDGNIYVGLTCYMSYFEYQWFTNDESGALLKLSPNGGWSVIAGNLNVAWTQVDGGADVARFAPIYRMMYDKDNKAIFLIDGSSLRKIDLSARVTTIPGNIIYNPQIDIGSDHNLYAYLSNAKSLPQVLKISESGVATSFSGSSVSGQADGPADKASFTFAYGIATDNQNNIFTLQQSNTWIVRFINSAGYVSTFDTGLHYTLRNYYPVGEKIFCDKLHDVIYITNGNNIVKYTFQ